jgi:hypothetical protein
MMWTSPLPNVARSASLGRSTPFGWEWTDPTASRSLGIMSVLTVALTGFERVPGMISTSVTTVPSRSRPSFRADSPRSRPMYSSGWVSSDASRAKSSVSSAIPMISLDRNRRISEGAVARQLRVADGRSGFAAAGGRLEAPAGNVALPRTPTEVCFPTGRSREDRAVAR